MNYDMELRILVNLLRGRPQREREADLDDALAARLDYKQWSQGECAIIRGRALPLLGLD
jgi:hypothetical protein